MITSIRCYFSRDSHVVSHRIMSSLMWHNRYACNLYWEKKLERMQWCIGLMSLGNLMSPTCDNWEYWALTNQPDVSGVVCYFVEAVVIFWWFNQGKHIGHQFLRALHSGISQIGDCTFINIFVLLLLDGCRGLSSCGQQTLWESSLCIYRSMQDCFNNSIFFYVYLKSIYWVFNWNYLFTF